MSDVSDLTEEGYGGYLDMIGSALNSQPEELGMWELPSCDFHVYRMG